MSEPMCLALAWSLTGALLCVLAVPLIRSRVPRNPFYGFRTRKTLRSDAIWYPANRYAGRALFVAGLVIAVGGLLTMSIAWALPAEVVCWFGLALIVVPLTVAVAKSLLFLRRL
ncbi:MAG: SdpI family protein [Chthonomonadales bacterium]|nr:SdpI family protein [Chthonomonadales bacterium]